MKTTASDCCRPQSHPISHKVECVPCEIPPFCRNHFFTGKLLTERDLNDEQRYLVDKLRLHLLRLHGWGVVCGLKVKPHEFCPDLRIVVEPGYAVDPCGHQILVPHEVQLPLPPKPPAVSVTADPCPPEPPAPATKPTAPPAPYPPGQHPAQQTSPEPERKEPPTEPPAPPPVCGPLWVCLRYAECETEFMPAPFDECACNGDGQKPNRICEGYELEVTFEEPTGLDRIRALLAECEGDCEEIYRRLLDGCAAPSPIDCIPLAVIRNWAPGMKVTPAMIDNLSWRPQLPSTHVLDQIIRCILDKLPVGGLTRITDMNWTHGEEYHCHDFVRFFVGDAAAPKAFEVTFEAPVRREGVTSQSFRALVVRRSDKSGDGGYVEVAPAEVKLSADRLRAHLRIDPGFVDRCLHGIPFDVRIELECDVVPDDRGHPVDGELQARVQGGAYLVAPPTGDGIPGGKFQSWIRVRA